MTPFGKASYNRGLQIGDEKVTAAESRGRCFCWGRFCFFTPYPMVCHGKGHINIRIQVWNVYPTCKTPIEIHHHSCRISYGNRNKWIRHGILSKACMYLDLPKGAKWFRCRVSINHPLGHFIGTPWKVLVYIYIIKKKIYIYIRALNPNDPAVLIGKDTLHSWSEEIALINRVVR